MTMETREIQIMGMESIPKNDTLRAISEVHPENLILSIFRAFKAGVTSPEYWMGNVRLSYLTFLDESIKQYPCVFANEEYMNCLGNSIAKTFGGLCAPCLKE